MHPPGWKAFLRNASLLFIRGYKSAHSSRLASLEILSSTNNASCRRYPRVSETDKGKIIFTKSVELSATELVSEEFSLWLKVINSVHVELLTFEKGTESEEYVYIRLVDSDLERLKKAYPVVGFMPWYRKGL